MVIENRIRQCGMFNVGNSGYFEVILQTLYHCIDFRQLVLGLDLTGTPKDCPTTFQLIRELQAIFQEWDRLEDILPPAEDPKEQVHHETLRLVYAHINPYIGPLGHVDPTRFVSTLKDCIHLSNPIDDPNDAHQFYFMFLQKFQTFLRMELVPKPFQETFRYLFVSKQRTVRRCLHCGADVQRIKHESQRFVPGYCFDCPIHTIQLDDVLQQNHLTPLLIEAMTAGDQSSIRIHRGSCSCRPGEVVPTRIFRRPVLEALPTILTVRFKRWPAINRNAFIQFDEYLNIGEDDKKDHYRHRCHSQRPSHQQLRYRLLSVVIHRGSSSDHGRYFSFCRTGDQWGQFWGTDVRPVDWETVKRESFGGHNEGQPTEELTNVGYLLFYERIKAPAESERPSTKVEETTQRSLADAELLRRLRLVSI